MIKSTKNIQSGFVSILVASILMVIMALITLGFSRVVQNEQRQALDNELSKQAYYAAESGINVVASSPDIYTTDKTDCDVSQYNNGYVNAGNEDAKFTCLLIDPTPEDLVFGNDSITTNKSKIVPIITASPPASLVIEWNDTNSDNLESCAVARDFEATYGDWNKISPLRIDLFGIPDGATFNRDNLVANQFGAIFYPCSGGGASTTYAAGSGVDVGRIIPANCTSGTSADYECRIIIDGVIAGQDVFYAKIKSLYNDVNVRITANDGSGAPLAFSYAQAVVDSTGRANDVFRRLQVRIPLYNNFDYPQATLQTVEDICKLYQVQATRVVDDCN
jgi:hypothetical protein